MISKLFSIKINKKTNYCIFCLTPTPNPSHKWHNNPQRFRNSRLFYSSLFKFAHNLTKSHRKNVLFSFNLANNIRILEQIKFNSIATSRIDFRRSEKSNSVHYFCFIHPSQNEKHIPNFIYKKIFILKTILTLKLEL